MMDQGAISDQLSGILEQLQMLVQMAYEAGDGGLAVWAEKACDDADQFLLSLEQGQGA